MVSDSMVGGPGLVPHPPGGLPITPPRGVTAQEFYGHSLPPPAGVRTEVDDKKFAERMSRSGAGPGPATQPGTGQHRDPNPSHHLTAVLPPDATIVDMSACLDHPTFVSSLDSDAAPHSPLRLCYTVDGKRVVLPYRDAPAGFGAWAVDHTRFELKEIIGRGSYGAVAEATDRVTGARVAVKRVKDVFESFENQIRLVFRSRLYSNLSIITCCSLSLL